MDSLLCIIIYINVYTNIPIEVLYKFSPLDFIGRWQTNARQNIELRRQNSYLRSNPEDQ